MLRRAVRRRNQCGLLAEEEIVVEKGVDSSQEPSSEDSSLSRYRRGIVGVVVMARSR